MTETAAGEPPLVHPMSFPRPRPLGAFLIGTAILITAMLMSVFSGGIVRLLLLLAGIAGASAVAFRWTKTVLNVDADGIEDVGLVRTRLYGWDDIRRARLSKDETTSIGPALVLDLPGGRHRMVVAGRGPDPSPDWPLARAAEVIDARARAPMSGRPADHFAPAPTRQAHERASDQRDHLFS